MDIPDNIEQTKELYDKLTGEKHFISTDTEDILNALKRGEKAVTVEIPWYEKVNGKTYNRNQILIQQIKNDRVYFCNTIKHGTEKEGEIIETGIRRTVHADGIQSMEMSEFNKLFKIGGGKALIKEIQIRALKLLKSR